MSEIIESTGREVAERTPDLIAAEIRIIEENIYKTAITGAIEIGNRLKEIKDALPHGEWYSFIAKNLGYSERQAQNFMKIAAEYGAENSPYLEALSKTHTCADLSISKALRLLQVPENEVENFAKNHNLSEVTVKEMEKEIKKLKSDIKAKEEENENTVKALESERKKSEETESELKNRISELGKQLSQAMSAGKESEIESLRKKLSSEIENLKSELEKSKYKEKVLEEKLSTADQATTIAIKQAVTEAKEKVAADAEKTAENKVAEKISELELANEEKEEEIAKLERKLAASADDTLIKLRIKTQDLQNILDDIRKLLQLCNDAVLLKKLKSAFAQILDSYKDIMEG